MSHRMLFAAPALVLMLAAGCTGISKEPAGNFAAQSDKVVPVQDETDPAQDETDPAQGQQIHPDTSAAAQAPVQGDTDDGVRDGEKPADVTDDGNANEDDIPRAEDDGTDEGISLIMVGDILLHDPVNRVCRVEGQGYDYSGIFAKTVDEIGNADIAIVNQEVIIGGAELEVSGYPAFNAPYEIGDELAETGFDIICHATNHSLDRGKKGIMNCLNFWESQHPEVTVLGIHDSEEDRNNICIYEQDGIRIAVLNYTYGTNGIRLPEGMPYAVDILDEDRVEKDLLRAEEMADFTVVCPHWGEEYSHRISTDQDKWCELFLKNGADLVIGTHPHVIEPVKWMVNEDTGDKMLVYYSIGNFVNWTAGEGPGTSDRVVGGMAVVNIGKNDRGGIEIKDHGVIALVCHLARERDKMTVYRLCDYSDELARSNEILSRDPSFSMRYCTDLCDEIWGDLWY
ncbi:MAG: CapA family protein [Lachnospiraceae bacterium]|nr:CapA family protein [Lachnospiraceae bacterium]